jgi:phosphoacetylglucosamine mutase
MVTASHNELKDNGIKISEPDGHMLWAHLEEQATAFCNADDDLIERVESSHVIVGGDSRPSTQHLKYLVSLGVGLAGGVVHDLGLVSTPQLHYTVRTANRQGNPALTLTDYY